MTTEQNKLYRSNINFMPVTVTAPKDFNMTTEYGHQNKIQRKNSHQNTLTSTASQAYQISKFNHSNEGQKQGMFLNVKEIQNTSCMSIDQAYLNPKFQKKKDFPNNRILPNNITDLQSDTQSIGGRSIRTHQGQDEYYKYWKTKAHEYLEENFRLREENKKLKNQIQNVKQESLKQLASSKKIDDKTDARERENKSFACLQSIFKKKLDELENQLKEKNIKIINLQDKVLELNRKISGQQERSELMQRLGAQIDTLSQENIMLKKQIEQLQFTPRSAQYIQTTPIKSITRLNHRSKEKPFLNQRKVSLQKGNRR